MNTANHQGASEIFTFTIFPLYLNSIGEEDVRPQGDQVLQYEVSFLLAKKYVG